MSEDSKASKMEDEAPKKKVDNRPAWMKNLFSLKQDSTGRIVFITLVAGLVGFGVAMIADKGALDKLSLAALDSRFQVRGPQPSAEKNGGLRVVAIDDKSQDNLQEVWPFPRSWSGQLVANLARMGTKVIDFDIFFNTDEKIAGDDTLFAKAICDVHEANKTNAAKSYVILGSAHSVQKMEGAINEQILKPTDVLWNECSEIAVVNQPEDGDSVVRKETIVLATSKDMGKFVPSYTLQAVALYQGLNWRKIGVPPTWRKGQYAKYEYFDSDADFPIDKRNGPSVPMNDQGQMNINYYGPNNTFKSMSFMDAVLVQLDPKYLLGIDVNSDGYSETKDKFIKLKRVREEQFNPFNKTVQLTWPMTTTSMAHDPDASPVLQNKKAKDGSGYLMNPVDDGFYLNDLSALAEVETIDQLPSTTPILNLRLAVQHDCQAQSPESKELLGFLGAGAINQSSDQLAQAFTKLGKDFEYDATVFQELENTLGFFKETTNEAFVKIDGNNLQLFDLNQKTCFEFSSGKKDGIPGIMKKKNQDWLDAAQQGFFVTGGKTLADMVNLSKARIRFFEESMEGKDSLYEVKNAIEAPGVVSALHVAEGKLWAYEMNQNRVALFDLKSGEQVGLKSFPVEQVLAYQKVIAPLVPQYLDGARYTQAIWHEESKSLLVRNAFTKDLLLYNEEGAPKKLAGPVKLFSPVYGANAVYIQPYEGGVFRLDLGTMKKSNLLGIGDSGSADSLAGFSWELMEETETDPKAVQVEKIYVGQKGTITIYRLNPEGENLRAMKLNTRYIPKGLNKDFKENQLDMLVYRDQGSAPFFVEAELDKQYAEMIGASVTYPEEGVQLAFTGVVYEPSNQVFRYTVNALAPTEDGRGQLLVAPNWIVGLDPFTDEFLLKSSDSGAPIDPSVDNNLKPSPLVGPGVSSGNMQFVMTHKLVHPKGENPYPGLTIMGFDNYRRAKVQLSTFTETMGGTITMVGPTAEALHDNFPTPFYQVSDTTAILSQLWRIFLKGEDPQSYPSPRTSGVEIHANAAQTALDENYLRYPAENFTLLVALLMGLIGAFLPQKMSQLKALGMAVSIMGVWIVISYMVFIGISLSALFFMGVVMAAFVMSLEELVPVTLEYYNGANGAKRRGAQYLLTLTVAVFAYLLYLFSSGTILDVFFTLFSDSTRFWKTLGTVTAVFVYGWALVFLPAKISNNLLPKFLWSKKAKATQDQEYHLTKANEMLRHSLKVLAIFIPLLILGGIALAIPSLRAHILEDFVFNMIMPPLAMIISTMLVTVFMAVTEGREKQRIKGMFSKYVNAEVVDQLLSNPEEIGLGGKYLEMTVFFSDIRGFTSISERMSAPELVLFLNEYLTAMTDIVFKYGGTLDKYIGDAVMAFWGAPFPLEDHAERGVRASLEMQLVLADLREMWAARGQKETIKIGCGLNSGRCVAGNIGSEKRMDYTVIGDTVNLAARLESITKQYGVGTIVSEFTIKHIKDICFFRVLDKIIVKGKTEPVTIYEVMAFHGPWEGTPKEGKKDGKK